MVATGHTVNRLPWQRASGKTAPQESTHLTLLLLTLMMMKRSGSFYLFIERPDGYLWNLHKSCRWFLRRINFIKKEEKCNKNIPKIFRWFRTPIRHESRDVGKMEWNFTFFFPVQRGNCPHTEEFYLHFFSFILIKFYLILLKEEPVHPMKCWIRPIIGRWFFNSSVPYLTVWDQGPCTFSGEIDLPSRWKVKNVQTAGN